MEDFVSFDLAKKLKRKGFVCKYPFAMYNELGVFHELYTSCDETLVNCTLGNRGYYDYDDFDECDCAAPTISQVLKWLREEKKIHIVIDVCNGNWEYSIKEKIRLNELLQYISQTTPVPICRSSSYEESALAGIEYCLDNLI